MRYNGYDNFNKLESGFEKGTKSLLKTGQKVGHRLGAKTSKIIGTTARRGFRRIGAKTAKAVKKTFRLLPKQIFIVVLIFVFIFVSFSSCGYLATDEDAGETGNRIENDNAVSLGGEEVVYSNANANCMAYYELLSREQSVWQEYVDENGNKVLIRADDEKAVTDYFKNDLEYFIDPNLLFCMNKYIFGNDFVYPEAFLKPVNYNKDTFELVPLTEDNEVCVESKAYNSNGSLSDDLMQTSVSDYGIATVMSYITENEVTRISGEYCKKEILYNDGTVGIIDISEPFSINIKTKEYNLLNEVVTFAGDVHYSYTPSTTQISSVSTGDSSSVETDCVEMYIYSSKTMYFACLQRVITDSSGNEVTGISLDGYPYRKRIMRYDSDVNAGYSQSYINKWILNNTDTIEYTFPDGTTEDLNVTYFYDMDVSKDYELKKYRTLDSGIYVDFVNQCDATYNDLGNGYLYDYLQNFATYYPTNISRSYNTFRQMSSQASNTNFLLSEDISYIAGEGANNFEQIYNGSEEGRKNLELMWDILITWGYTEIQASAVMGNIGQESSYISSEINSIGATGLCQWLDDRKTKMVNFAGSMGRDWTDIESQMTFACMELSTDEFYDHCSYQWTGHMDEAYIFENSTDIAEVTEAICVGWERCGDDEANMDNRISCAISAYETFSGRIPETQALKIAPSGSMEGEIIEVSDTSYTTKNMNQYDKKMFNLFYHAVDDIYNGEYILEYKVVNLSETEVNNLLLLTNSYINGTSMDDERLNSVSALWTADYLSNLSKKRSSVAEIYGVDYLSEPRLTVESVAGLPYWGPGSVFYDSGYGLPNCTAWVFGRREEVTGEEPPSIFYGDAKTWWTENIEAGTYRYGDVPEAGAIMVWGGSGAGHVAFVEQVNADGTMTISQSGWKMQAWYPYNIKTDTIENVERYSSARPFLGYIYLN